MARSRRKSQTPDASGVETHTAAQEAATQAAAGRGNAARQARLRSATGFKGDLSSFTRRMEGAFGASFAGVEILGGAEGAGGARSGAAATTVGEQIFLGERFAELGEQDQEHILAHELSHVVQQRAATRAGGGGAGGRADAEADADQSAAQALSGGHAAPQVAIAGGAAHDFDLMEAARGLRDRVGEAVEDTAEDALELAIEQIENARMLLAFIERFGAAAARKAIDFLADHKVEILVSFLTLNPASGLVVYIVRKLPTDEIEAWLRSAEVQTAVTVVGLVLAAGFVGAIAAPLLALGPLALPILKELSGPAFAVLWEHAPDDLKDLAIDAAVSYWPVGLGLDVEGHIGATFGYPIYLGADAFVWMSHMEEGTFHLQRGGFLVEAFDSGVGAGGFLGLGGGDRPGQEGQGMGIGGEVGAEVMAGLKQYINQEFDFPVREDAAFASFLIAVLQADTSASMGIASLLSPTVAKVNPAGYNTMTKIELKAFAEGNAAGQGGVRKPGEGTQQGGGTWDQADGARDNGAPTGIWKWLQATVAGRIAAEAGVGMEVRNREFRQDADGVRTPSHMEVDLYGEGSAAASIVHSIPVISRALPQVPQFDGGAGIRVTWDLRHPAGVDMPTAGPPLWSLYGKTGDLDRYSGAASETSIAVGNLSAETFQSWDSFLDNIRAGSTVKRRFGLGGGIGRRFWRIADRQGAFTTLVPAEYRRYGFRVEGYLDLESALDADDVRWIFNEIGAASARYLDGGEPLQQLYTDVLTFLATGHGPPDVTAHLRTIADVILAGVKKLQFHGLAGLSAAAGAKIAAEAKVRLDARVGAQITMDKNLLSYVDGQLDVADIEDLLQGAGEVARNVLELEGEEQD